jgi:hypothetical protein
MKIQHFEIKVKDYVGDKYGHWTTNDDIFKLFRKETTKNQNCIFTNPKSQKPRSKN